MKILHLLDSMGRGGTETQVLDVCRNAARFGLDITLVAASGGVLEPDFRESGVEVIRLERKLPVDLYLASQLRRIIRERRIEIARGYQAVEGLHLYLATRGLKNVRTALSHEGFVADKKNRVTLKFLIPRVDSNIYVSESLRKWLKQKDKLNTDIKQTVIFNGADPERLRGSGRSIRRELGIGADAPLIGMIANFYRDPRKDHFTLARSLPEVMTALPEAHCIFAGGIQDGAEDKMAECLDICLKNGIEQRVHFLGTRGDIPDILSELDVFVLSSLQEGMPVAISEAMLVGVPLVLSDIEPHLEASQNGKYASVFPTGDADALSSELIRLLSDKNVRNEMSVRAKAFAQENMSIDSHLRQLAAHYRSMIDA
ncbi:MAG: glycosyltransferase family 4 protein [Pyrinomonadaceae bacterium]|nr:glycosyltransferase family 4 protein [Pyrinomonadaceae bacterium]MBP6212863.1 glycosyltransferase family 4 protein [Pyrinomonadaceae bacterium]